MKTIKFFAVLTILLLISEKIFSQGGNFDTSFVLLSSPTIDYKNPQFDKSGPSVNYNITDCILAYEKWSEATNSNIAVRFMTYNSLSTEVDLTNDTFINKNPAVAYHTGQFTTGNSNGAVVFQSNKNGNYDIFFSYYNSVTWSPVVQITSSSEDETSPSIIPYRIGSTVNYIISYQRANDIYIRNYFNGTWMSEINVTSNDSLKCISPKLTLTPFTSDFYLAYQRMLNDTTKSIAFHRNLFSPSGEITIRPQNIIVQSESQENIRFANGVNYSILTYDYVNLGIKSFYAAFLYYDNYNLVNVVTAYISGQNFGGTGSSHGDITSDYIGGYTLASWIRKIPDSTQIIIAYSVPLGYGSGRFYIGNMDENTFVNTSTKLVFGSKFRIRILWEKKINGRTAIVESFRDMNLTSVIKTSSNFPEKFSLSQNYPNPFNPVTKVKFDVKRDARREMKDVRLIVYDALGKEVATLFNEKLSAGSYEVEFDGSNFSSGVFFYKLITENFSEVKRMILLK